MAKEVSFSVSREDQRLITRCVARACDLGLIFNEDESRISLNMDLCAAKAQGCNIDFQKLLGFDSFNFSHDISGIRRHMNRRTGKLMNCFLPRAARGGV